MAGAPALSYFFIRNSKFEIRSPATEPTHEYADQILRHPVHRSRADESRSVRSGRSGEDGCARRRAGGGDQDPLTTTWPGSADVRRRQERHRRHTSLAERRRFFASARSVRRRLSESREAIRRRLSALLAGDERARAPE